MENSRTPGTGNVPEPAARSLERVADATRWSENLELPAFFHGWIGAAVAVQIASFGWAAAQLDRPLVAALVVLAGAALFVAVAAMQLWRFRRRNGVRIDGLASRAVFGTSAVSSIAFAAGLAIAAWAAVAGVWPAAIPVSIAAGAVYAWSGRRWWARYRGAPVRHARAEPAWLVLLVAACAAGGLVLVLAIGR